STVPGQMRGALIAFMTILMAIVGLVLLIACANVGSMTLARASSRSKEMAIRLAVGAGRFRIMRQLLIESLLLFLLGGAAGVILAVWATRLLLSFKFSADVPVSLDLGIDVRVLLFTLGTSLATGLVFGLAPALQASRHDVLTALNNDTSRGTHRSRTRSIFVTAQIAISLVLLVTAGLFLRSLRNASSIDLGLNPQGIETVTFDLGTQGYSDTKGKEFYRQLMERVSSLPGVSDASLARMVPLNGSNMKADVYLPGREPKPGERGLLVGMNVVDAAYFKTLQIPMLYGRTFSDGDNQAAPRVAVVNETMARRFYPGADISSAVGQTFSIGNGPIQIVGVVKDGKYDTLGEDPQPFLYRPLSQSYSGEMTLHVRASVADAGNVLAAVRREAGALDRDVPLLNVMTLNEQIGYSMLPLRVATSVA